LNGQKYRKFKDIKVPTSSVKPLSLNEEDEEVFTLISYEYYQNDITEIIMEFAMQYTPIETFTDFKQSLFNVITLLDDGFKLNEGK
jgi:hypothetical protein